MMSIIIFIFLIITALVCCALATADNFFNSAKDVVIAGATINIPFACGDKIITDNGWKMGCSVLLTMIVTAATKLKSNEKKANNVNIAAPNNLEIAEQPPIQ